VSDMIGFVCVCVFFCHGEGFVGAVGLFEVVVDGLGFGIGLCIECSCGAGIAVVCLWVVYRRLHGRRSQKVGPD
jgi:hypothetical protein